VRSELASRSAARKACSVAAADELEHAAAVVQPHPGGRLHLGHDDALGPAECLLGFLEPSLGDHRHAEGQVGKAGDRLIGPAMPFGQLDRLPAALRSQRERPPAPQLGPVSQAGDLQIGAPDLVSQGDAVLEVPVRVVEASGPRLGDAEIDKRQGPQIPAQPGLRQVRHNPGGEQPLGLLGHGREVPALAGQAHPHHGDHDPRAATPVRGHRVQSLASKSQIPFGLLE
jgi:hypothetical protein